MVDSMLNSGVRWAFIARSPRIIHLELWYFERAWKLIISRKNYILTLYSFGINNTSFIRHDSINTTSYVFLEI